MKKITKLFLLSLGFLAFGTLSSCKKEDTTWYYDTQNHYHLDGEEQKDVAAHDLEVVDHKDATCTEDGYNKYKCKTCDYEYEAPVTKLGHEMEYHGATQQSCTTPEANEYYYCETCQKYFSDAEGNTEITKDSWIIKEASHGLVHKEAKAATIYEAGNVDCYYCEDCKKYFTDENANTEIAADNVVISQLVATVSQARSAEVGKDIIVKGVVVGCASTGATSNLTAMLIIKDLENNSMIAVAPGKKAETCCLYKGLNAAAGGEAIELAYPKGTVIQMPVTVTQSAINYANGQAGIKYLSFSLEDTESDTYIIETTDKYTIDKTASDITTISSQEDLFKFFGLANGSNILTSEGYAYDYTVAAANAFKVIKFSGNLKTVAYNTGSATFNAQYHRVFVDEEVVCTLATQVITAKGKNGAKQNLSIVFRNCNTKFNTGKQFAELLYGASDALPSGSYSSPNTFNGDVYCIFVGGNDYYAQLVILDASDVIAFTGS